MNPSNHPARRRFGTVTDLAPGTDALASEWLVRQREGLNPAEERELQAWLAADSAHAEAFAEHVRADRIYVKVGP